MMSVDDFVNKYLSCEQGSLLAELEESLVVKEAYTELNLEQRREFRAKLRLTSSDITRHLAIAARYERLRSLADQHLLPKAKSTHYLIAIQDDATSDEMVRLGVVNRNASRRKVAKWLKQRQAPARKETVSEHPPAPQPEGQAPAEPELPPEDASGAEGITPLTDDSDQLPQEERSEERSAIPARYAATCSGPRESSKKSLPPSVRPGELLWRIYASHDAPADALAEADTLLEPIRDLGFAVEAVRPDLIQHPPRSADHPLDPVLRGR